MELSKIFVDTAWASKKHMCYDPEKNIFFEVDDPTKFRDYGEIFLDSSLFPNMWQQLRELISNGKKVYYFTRPFKWRETRKRFKESLKVRVGEASKSDKVDVYTL